MKVATPNNLVNVGSHVASKQYRINTLFSINAKGEGAYIKNGRSYTEEEFKTLFPIVQVKNNANENIDGTKKWMS